ncbi:peptidoglycan recognition family protein [Sandaracinus amylolyticus]|uniref:peptidoglycan recognition protein family protein n=1 Tax=Sandaracinus amylolyticus TaxID=927083 RepID=UPI001F170006|nr:peptidoglycan recognition family protein [Sandaracinus amylolyticus]
MRSTTPAIAVLCLVLVATVARAQDFPRGRDAGALIRTPGVRARTWTAIIVHHSASSEGNAASMDAYHRGVRHMPRGLAYHFVIGNGHGLGDGEIEVGPRWTQQQPGAHVASRLRDASTRALWDEVAIGIVLVGNFEETAPTRRQLATLSELVSALQRRFRIEGARVFDHGEIDGAHTACPGRSLHRVVRGLRSRADG